MGLLPDLTARIRMDTSDLDKARVKAGAAANGISDELKKVGDKHADLGKKMSVGISLPIVAGFAYATKAASDLGEQLSKSQNVFGKSSATVEAFAKTSAQSLGISQRAALEAAGTFGNLFRAIGLTAPASAELSKNLVRTASDLASFNNANPEEVLEALRAGLTGEAEPLKRFGININEARIATEALAIGVLKTGEAMNAGAKAQAVYSLIQKDTILAQGDFSRTSAGLANQQRIVKAEFENTAATMGQKLLPAALGLAHGFSSVLDGLNKLPDGAQSVLLVGVAATAAAGPVLGLIGKLEQMQSRMTAGGAAAKALGVGIKGIGVASAAAAGLTVLVTAYNAIKEAGQPAAESVAKMEARLLKLSLGLSTSVPKIDDLSKRLEGSFNRMSFESSSFKKNRLAGDLDEIDEALAGLVTKGHPEAARKALSEFAIANGTTSQRLLENKKFLNEYQDALKSYKTEKQAANLLEKDSAAIEDASKNATQQHTEAYQGLTNAIKAAKDQQDEYLGVALTYDEAQDKLAKSTADLAASIKTNGDVFTGNTEAALANREALRGGVEAALAFQRAEEAQSGATLTETQRRERQIQLLQQLASTSSPAARAEIQRYIDKLNSTPEAIKTRLEFEWATAEAAINAARQALDKLQPLIVKTNAGLVQISRSGHGQIPVGKAQGGDVRAGVPVGVGEYGPELFIPKVSGRVVSNAQSKQLVGNGGNVTKTYISNVYPRVASFNARDQAAQFRYMELAGG